MSGKLYWTPLPQKWSLGPRTTGKQNFWNKAATRCAAQNFEQKQGFFVKTGCEVPE